MAKVELTKYTSISALHQLYAPQGGKADVEPWFCHPQRQTYIGVVFDPLHRPTAAYNLYHGLNDLTPVHNEQKWALFRAHMLHNVAGGVQEYYDYIMNWFAHLVQRPYKKPGTCIALRGPQGAGKGFAIRTFGHLVRDYFTTISQADHLTGKHNAHMAHTLLLFADEAFWAATKPVKTC